LLTVLFLPLAQLRSIVKDVVQPSDVFPWFQLVGKLDNPNAILPVSEYGTAISYMVVWFGLAGLVILSLRALRRPEHRLGTFVLVGWAAMLFVGSRIESLGFPVRIARDLATPLVIAAAAGIAVAWEWSSDRRMLLRVPLVIVAVWLAYPHAYGRLYRIRHYEETMQFSTAHTQALKVVGTAPAAAIDRLIPAAYAPNVRPVEIHFSDAASTLLSSTTLHALEGIEYALVTIPKGQPEGTYPKSLGDAGFSETRRFYDPANTVVLYQK
jgi:hypothetical protein